MAELDYMSFIMGALGILGGIALICIPKQIYGYNSWSKERQDAFNIKGFSRLVGTTSVLSGVGVVVATFFMYGDQAITAAVVINAFVVIFMSKRYYKKR